MSTKINIQTKNFGYGGNVHGRSVTEIWGRDEIKNMDLREGGGETKILNLSGDKNSNMVKHA